MAEMDSVRRYLVTQLMDLIDAERQLIRALPAMANVAATARLRGAFELHLTETRAHVRRLKRALRHLGVADGLRRGFGRQADSKRSPGMRALLEESTAMTSGAAEGPIRDAVLIASARKVEHYEIAGYAAAQALAHVLGLPGVGRLLAQTLREERLAEQRLTQIAGASVNDAAAAEWSAELMCRPSRSSRGTSPSRTSTQSSMRRMRR